ncbi:MAG: BatA domain-containing protein, partial [Bacteroidales bacterium]|nr:BatA domain-containing protein [Bacteroidales bacterium]MBQ3833073.1 BatA domain-containing protein [Bacteroidales bacterium]
MEFANPEYLWFLTVLIPMIAWYVWRRKKSVASMNVSSLEAFSG